MLLALAAGSASFYAGGNCSSLFRATVLSVFITEEARKVFNGVEGRRQVENLENPENAEQTLLTKTTHH